MTIVVEISATGTSRVRPRRQDGSGSTRPGARRVSRPLVVALVILLALAGSGVGAVWWLQRSLVGNIESLGDPFSDVGPSGGGAAAPGAAADPTTPADAAADGAMDLLVLGSDSRISAGDPSQWEVGAQRTDTIMLVHVPADRQGVVVTSIPRDSWVDIPGHGQGKINAAFSYGGPALTIETVTALTGVEIDHVVTTDLESFETITDALGGVQLTLQEDLVVGDTVVPAGKHRLLTGEQALAFVRERKNLPRGDLDRVQRQQAWVRAMVAKVRNDGTLRNPLSAHRLLDTVTSSIAADDGFDAGVVDDLRSLATDLGSNDIVFLTAPTLGTGTSPDGQSIVELDRPALETLMASVRDDTVVEHVASNPDAYDLLPAVVE